MWFDSHKIIPLPLRRKTYKIISSIGSKLHLDILKSKFAGEILMSDKIKTAVITGGHAFDVINFHHLFRSIPQIDFYPQNMEDFVTNTAGGPSEYDVLVFYNMQLNNPPDEGNDLEKAEKEVLSVLGDSGQGILILHHSILAFPNWEVWRDLVGIQNRKIRDFDHNQNLKIEVLDSGHPITVGLSSWEMVDETYEMDNAGEGSEILLTLSHPNSMKTIAWTRKFKKSRVFCYQLGHDDQAYSNDRFRAVITRGILWSVRKI